MNLCFTFCSANHGSENVLVFNNIMKAKACKKNYIYLVVTRSRRHKIVHIDWFLSVNWSKREWIPLFFNYISITLAPFTLAGEQKQQSINFRKIFVTAACFSPHSRLLKLSTFMSSLFRHNQTFCLSSITMLTLRLKYQVIFLSQAMARFKYITIIIFILLSFLLLLLLLLLLLFSFFGLEINH